MARLVRRVGTILLIVGAGYVVWRWVTSRQHAEVPASDELWSPLPIHVPSQVVPPGGPESSPPGTTWIDPLADACPTSHPVKATLADQRYSAPSDPGYEEIVPDRCYVDAPAATADGFRPVEH